MSNLNEDDIAEYQEKTKNYGLYEVEQVETLGYENGKEMEPSTWWAVSNRLFPELECYECKNKEVAEDLCRQMNLLTQDLMLAQTLPKPLTIDTKNVTPITTLAIMINNKHDKLEELRNAINHELSCELTYLHNSNAWRLKPADIQQELELTKLPTEKQIQAFIEEKLSKEFDLWKIAKANTALIRQQLGLIEDRISLEKYAIRLELKK